MTRILWVTLGWLTLGLAILGILLPLLPTTPFLLLSAFCFSKGSAKIHHWIISHKWFGPPIRDWQAGKGISLKAKVTAIISLWLSIGYAAHVVAQNFMIQIMLVIIAASVSLFLIKVKTKRIE